MDVGLGRRGKGWVRAVISLFASKDGRVAAEDGIRDVFSVGEVLVFMFEIQDLLGGFVLLDDGSENSVWCFTMGVGFCYEVGPGRFAFPLSQMCVEGGSLL